MRSNPRRTLTLSALTVLLLLPGCLGATEEASPVTPAAADDAAAEDGTSPAAPGVQGEDRAAAAAAAEEQNLELRDHPVDESGQLPRAANAAFLTVSDGITSRFDRWFDLTVDGAVVGGKLTLTWTPGQGTEELRLMFGPTEKDDGGTRLKEGYAFVMGPPPLELDLGEVDWAEDDYAVAVWWTFDEPAHVRDAVEFNVEGELLHAVPAEGAS